MEPWMIVLWLFLYFIFEFINSILFNWKLYLVTEKKYTRAGVFGAFSTLLFLTSIILSVYVSTGNIGENQEPIFWIIPAAAIMMGIGNFLAALLVPHIRKFIKNKNK